MPSTAMQAIIAALETIGPMTMKQLQIHLDRSYSSVHRPLTTLRNRGMIRIARWKRQVGVGGRHAPVYALGSGKPDAKEPGSDCRGSKLRYYQTHADIINLRAKIKRGTAVASPWRGLL